MIEIDQEFEKRKVAEEFKKESQFVGFGNAECPICGCEDAYFRPELDGYECPDCGNIF